MKKLDVVGRIPPPFGGVTVHNSRLACYAGAKGWRVRIFEFSKRKSFTLTENVSVYPFDLHNPFALVRLLCSRAPIHFCGGPWLLWCFFGLLGLLGRKVVVVVHPGKISKGIWILRYGEANAFKKWLFRICCRGFDSVITPHVWLQKVVLNLNLPLKKVVLQSFFIPPTFKSKDYEAIPKYVWRFIKKHNPVLGACGNRFVFLDGVDVYGADMLIPLIRHLRDSGFPNCGLIFVVPEVENRAYFEELQITSFFMDLNRHVMFVRGEREAYPIWSHLDLFLRPTYSDTDAFSALESLCVGVPVVASDCVERPKEMVTFNCRNLEDLEAKTKMVLGDIEKYRVKDYKPLVDDFVRLY